MKRWTTGLLVLTLTTIAMGCSVDLGLDEVSTRIGTDEVKVVLQEPVGSDPLADHPATWTSDEALPVAGALRIEPHAFTLRVVYAGETGSRWYSTNVRFEDWQRHEDKLVFAQPAGRIELRLGPDGDLYQGPCLVIPNRDLFDAYAHRFDGPLQTQHVLALIFHQTDPEYLDALSAHGHRISWQTAVELAQRRIPADYVHAMRRLPQPAPTPVVHHEDTETLPPLPTFTADEITKLHFRGVKPEFIRGLREAGYRFNTDELIKLKFRGVTAAFARDMVMPGHPRYTADELVKLKFRGVSPTYVTGMHDAGYHFSTKDLINLKFRGVTVAFARGYRQAGYAFDADDLINLKFRGVTPQYAAAMADERYDPLTAKELIDFEFRGVDPALVRELRTQ